MAHVRARMAGAAELTEDAGARRAAFSGALTLSRIGGIGRKLDDLPGDGWTIDISGVERMDTVGAWLLHRMQRDRGARIVGADEGAQRLLAQVADADQAGEVRNPHRPAGARYLDEIGAAVANTGHTLGGLMGFLGGTLVNLGAVIARPKKLRVNAIVQGFEAVGVKALGIIGLMSFLIGIVVAQQGAVQLAQFGAEVYTINLIGRLTIRELGVLMTAIMVAGRSGSAFAAQLGTMKLTEEVDAMRTIGVSPMQALVIPRVLATTLMMPLLAFYACILAVFGGGVFSWIVLDIPPATFITRIREVVPMTDWYITLIKAPTFGLIIGIVGCYQGLLVEGDAEQVGRRTTSAVVQAIFLVIVLDAIFAVFFSGIGWI